MQKHSKLQSKQGDRQPAQDDLVATSKNPVLFLEVNLGKSQQERLIIYEGDVPELVVIMFARCHKLNEEKQRKLMTVVNDQLKSILPSIAEDQLDQVMSSPINKP